MQVNPQYEKIIEALLEHKYAVVEHFFSNQETAQLRESLWHKYQDNNFKKSAIGNLAQEKIIDTIRGDFICWIDEFHANEAEMLFFDKINDFVTYLNRTCFLGIESKEFHYALYPEGTFYKRHLDTFQNDSRRKLSMVCYLNTENWQPDFGGALVIYPENNAENPITILPEKGKMVIFESQVLEHEVQKVKHPRFSITGWLKTR